MLGLPSFEAGVRLTMTEGSDGQAYLYIWLHRGDAARSSASSTCWNVRGSREEEEEEEEEEEARCGRVAR